MGQSLSQNIFMKNVCKSSQKQMSTGGSPEYNITVGWFPEGGRVTIADGGCLSTADGPKLVKIYFYKMCASPHKNKCLQEGHLSTDVGWFPVQLSRY